MTFKFVSAHTHMTFRFVSAHTRMTFRFVSAHTRMTFRFVTSNTVDDVQYSVILYCMMTFRFIKTFDMVRLITPFVLYGIEVRQCPNAVKHLLCSYCMLIWLKWFMLHLAYGDLQVHQHDWCGQTNFFVFFKWHFGFSTPLIIMAQMVMLHLLYVDLRIHQHTWYGQTNFFVF